MKPQWYITTVLQKLEKLLWRAEDETRWECWVGEEDSTGDAKQVSEDWEVDWTRGARQMRARGRSRWERLNRWGEEEILTRCAGKVRVSGRHR